MTDTAVELVPFVVDPVVPFVARPDRYSMSRMRNFTRCALMGKLEQDTGDQSGEFAAFGKLFHEVAAAIGFACSMRGEQTVETAHALSIARTLLTEPFEVDPLPPHHYDELLAMVERWSATAFFRTDADLFAIEQSYRHVLPGTNRILSARVDQLSINHNVAEIEDYKTGPGLASQETVEKGLQGINYAWHVWLAHPHVDTFIYTERYVRWGTPRVVYYELGQVFEHEDYLRALVARMDKAYDTGKFKPTPGSWCNTCPAPDRCPIPERNRSMFIVDSEAALREMEALLVEKARVKQREAAIKAWLDANDLTGAIVGDQRLGWTLPATKTEVDKAALARDGIDLEHYRREVEPEPRWGTRKARDSDPVAERLALPAGADA